MNEKKLTDEEIVEALKFAIAQKEADWIGYWNEKYQWIEFPMKDVLDLIHRLKKGRKTFFRIAKQRNEEKRELEKKVEEQQAENERLTEREKFLENAWHTSIEHTETVERGLNASEARNAELQKQVDELKASREIEINELHEQHAIVAEEIKKDTAREIYAQVLEWSPVGENYHWFITTLENWLKERYGVEVE